TSRLESSFPPSNPKENTPGPGTRRETGMSSAMPLPSGGKIVAPRYGISTETAKILEQGEGVEAMGPVSTLKDQGVSFSQSRRVPEFIDGPARIAAEVPAPNEYDAVGAHLKLTEKGQYPSLNHARPSFPMPGKGCSMFDEIAETKRSVPGPGAYNPQRPPLRQSKSKPVVKCEGETIAESRRLFLAREVPGPGAYEMAKVNREPTLAVMQPGEARLPYSMPKPFDYNCRPDVGRKFISSGQNVCRKLLRVSSSSKLIDMLTKTAPVASRTKAADRIFGRFHHEKSSSAVKGFMDRKSSLDDCNMALDLLPDGEFGVVTFEAAGIKKSDGGDDQDQGGDGASGVPSGALLNGLKWRFGEDFGLYEPAYEAIEGGPVMGPIEKDIPYSDRLGLSHEVYSTKLAGHMYEAKPDGLFLPEASIDRRIVSVGGQADDDWFDCHHERVSTAARMLSEATQSLLDPLDTGILLDRAEAALMDKATTKSKLLGMCSNRREALLKELPVSIAERRAKLKICT
ncbi:hypothetical protein FOL47_006068, partial [Perkinsus chesapeaki]